MYWISIPVVSATGEMTAASAARICAPRRPPMSRAIKPTSTATAPCASAGKRRMPVNELPKSVNSMRASSGVSGG